jgi:UDP-2-acetamido-3-amino-2,3-dideoxy-glucuronate N-acetyltransferase
MKGKIEKGNNVKIYKSTKIYNHEESSLILKDNVYLGRYVVIINHFHDLSLKGDRRNEKPSNLIIEKNAYIGYGAMIMPQVTHIGKNAIIGAGSVLTKNVPNNEIWAGNPAKKIGIRE